MATIYEEIRRQEIEAARQFGLMFRRWRLLNGWTQYTARNWADEAGFIYFSTHAGTSELESGRLVHPRTKFFKGIGAMNARLAAQDFSGVTTRKLLDQIKQGRPILNADGTPWGPVEFWSCHVGLLPPVDWLAGPGPEQAPGLSDEQAQQLSAGWAERARAAVQEGRATMAQLALAPNVATAENREKWAQVLMGFDAYDAESLRQLWDPALSEWLPNTWLATWMGQFPERVGDARGGGSGSEA